MPAVPPFRQSITVMNFGSSDSLHVSNCVFSVAVESRNPATAAFIRYLRQEIRELAGREFFHKIARANTPKELEKLGLTDLRLLPALQKYDSAHNPAFAERARMLIWRFASAFVAADEEGTIDEEAALEEFQKVLDGRTSWSLLGFQPENLALLLELETTINEAKHAVEVALQQEPGKDDESFAGDVALARSLQAIAVHLAWTLQDVSDAHVRFYRDFAWFFDKISNHLPTDNVSYWRSWLETMSREPAPVFRDPFFLRVEYLAAYDLANGTNYADRCRTMFFRFANAFVKADGKLSEQEQAALEKLKEFLYSPATAVPAAIGGEQKRLESAAEKIKLQDAETHSPDELLTQLRSMVGLERVKADVTQLVNFLKVQQLRASKGLPSAQMSRHLVVMG